MDSPAARARPASYVTIQWCRAIAALLVVAFHTAGNLAKDKYFGVAAAPLEALMRFGGTAGVAFFFVLSGFIIARVHYRDFGIPHRLGPYLRKRIVRIYPPFVLIFLAVYGTAWLVPTLRETLPTDIGVLLKALLLIPQDPKIVGGLGSPVLIVAWSLHYEMIFYAAVALAIIHRWLLVAAVVVFLVNFALAQLGGASTFPQSFFANRFVFLFGMGMAVAALGRQAFPLPYPRLVAVAAAITFFGIGISNELTAWSATLPLLEIAYGAAGSMVVLALVRYEDMLQKPLRHATASLLGDASYALYLLHFPLIAVLSKAAMAAGMQGAAAAHAAFLAITAACVVSAVVFHKVVERPLTRRLQPRTTGKGT